MTKDEALRLALDYITSTNKRSEFWLVPESKLNKTVTAIKKALEQPEPEPVAACKKCGKQMQIPADECLACERGEQPEPKPVASIFVSGIGEREFDDWGAQLPVGRNLLYTSPPKREPLTEEEMDAIFDSVMEHCKPKARRIAVTRAIEAAHGIKGEA